MFMSQVPKAESSKTSKERQLTKGRAIQRAREGAPSAVVAALRGPVCGLYLSLSGQWRTNALPVYSRSLSGPGSD